MRQRPCLGTATLILAAAIGCRSDPRPGQKLSAVRESAQILLEEKCGRCHISTLDTAQPKALAVFDLTQHDWSRGLTPAQLHSAMRRMEAVFGTQPDEVADRELFRVFVELEIREREL